MNFFREKNISLDWLLISKVLAGIFIFFIFFNTCRSALDPDLGWHIRTGQLIIENRAVPHYDELSFTMPGHAWIDHEWVVNIIFALFYKQDIWMIIVLAFSLITFIPFFFWISKAEEKLQLIPILLAGIIFSQFVSVRPQLISFALFFFVFLTVFKLEEHKKSLLWGKYKFVLPLVFFLWANLHAGFFSGLVLIFVYILAKFISSIIKKNTYLELRQDVFCLFLCTLATLANPYGIKIYGEIVSASTNSLAVEYINEWKPLFMHSDPSSLIFSVFLSFFLLLIFVYFRKLNPIMLFVSLFFLLAGIKSFRLIPFFIIASLPIFFAAISNFQNALGKWDFLDKRRKGLVELFALVIFLAVYSATLLSPANSNGGYPKEEAMKVLQNYIQDKKEARIFNAYEWGGYLELRLPQTKFFIDGRMPHWRDGNNSAMEDYVEVLIKGNWENVFSKRKIDLVFIGKSPEEKNRFSQKIKDFFFLGQRNNINKTDLLVKNLQQKEWKIIYEDQSSIMLAKNQ